MRLDRYVGAFMFVILAAEILVLIFIIYFIGREIRKIYKQRKAYFKVGVQTELQGGIGLELSLHARPMEPSGGKYEWSV